MFYFQLKNHYKKILGVYALSILGNIFGQLYPLATALAINGVVERDFSAVGWLIACRSAVLVFELSSRMVDTRVFTSLYASMATTWVSRAHKEGISPSVVAARCSLSREYIIFLERDVHSAIFAIGTLVVSTTALFWLDLDVGILCLMSLGPLVGVNYWLARKSFSLSGRLNTRLEKEIAILREGINRRVIRHFKALSGWRIHLSDAEAKACAWMEASAILLIALALWRLTENGTGSAGAVYAVFAYLARYIEALEQVPLLVQQLAKLRDINHRLSQVCAPA